MVKDNRLKGGIFWGMTGLLVFLSGCGVSKSDYQEVVAERDSLKEKLTEVQKQNESLKDEVVLLQHEKKVQRDQVEEFKLKLLQCERAVPAKPSPAKRVSGPGADSYMVKPGDTLWSISQRTGVPVDTLRRLNHIEGDQIKAGQELILKE